MSRIPEHDQCMKFGMTLVPSNSEVLWKFKSGKSEARLLLSLGEMFLRGRIPAIENLRGVQKECLRIRRDFHFRLDLNEHVLFGRRFVHLPLEEYRSISS